MKIIYLDAERSFPIVVCWIGYVLIKYTNRHLHFYVDRHQKDIFYIHVILDSFIDYTFEAGRQLQREDKINTTTLPNIAITETNFQDFKRIIKDAFVGDFVWVSDEKFEKIL